MNIITLRENILSALPLSMAKDYEKMNRELNTDKETLYYKTFKPIFDKAFGKDSKGKPIYRKYINVEDKPIDKEIYSFLKQNGYNITEEEFNAGIIIKNKDNKNNHLSLDDLKKKGQVLRIGRILNKKKAPQKLILKWDKISKQISNKKLIVISRHPYDIAGQSTDRSWESCMTLPTDKQKGGEYCNFVDTGIKSGVLIAYLISNDDKNINKPFARVLIKPYLNKDKNTAYFKTSEIYGVAGNEFKKTVQKWVNKNLNKVSNDKYYLDFGNIYMDNVDSKVYLKYRKIKGKYRPKTKKELSDIVSTLDNINLSDIDTSNITDMSKLFMSSNRNDWKGIETWDTSNVKDMSYMFENSNFNQDISNWNISNVENMEGMFRYSNFNQDISNWNTSKVKNMKYLFAYSSFNQNISKWNVSSVENMKGIFYGSIFDKNISKWDVSNVKDMSYMFANSNFNKDISKWDVSNVTNMEGMFERSNFNQDISNWNVSNVTNMNNIFDYYENNIPNWYYESYYDSTINKYKPKDKSSLKLLLDIKNIKDIDISLINNLSSIFYNNNRNDWKGIETWNVSKVEDMSYMFAYSNFNGNLSKWNVSNVKNMSCMFKNSNFNGDISNWNVNNVENMNGMFENSPLEDNPPHWYKGD